MHDIASRTGTNIGSGTKPSRYHPALVALHWILAVLILLSLMNGTFWLKTTANSSPEKIAMLGAHMSMGIAILVLMIARFAVRAFTGQPERASTGSALLCCSGCGSASAPRA